MAEILNNRNAWTAVGLAVAAPLASIALFPQQAAEAHAVVTGTSASREDVRKLQRDLNDDLSPLGMPALAVDGIGGRLTKRALCAERWLTGAKVTRSMAGISSKDIARIDAADDLRSPYVRELGSRMMSGLVINETCQVGIRIVGSEIKKVFPVSTGTKEKGTPNTVSRMSLGINGWHNSTLYPSENDNGNMGLPQYFDRYPAVATHASREFTSSTTAPTSRGCIRVTGDMAEYLWDAHDGPANAPHPDRRRQMGRPATIAVTGAYEYNIK